MLECQNRLFNIEDNVSYLNCAYMSPQLNSVTLAGQDAVAQKQQPYRITGDDFFTGIEKLKDTFAKFINANNSAQIVPIPSVSYGIANAALNIPFEKGDKILILEDQFPSNVYPWMNVCQSKETTLTVVKRPPINKDWTLIIINAIDSQTRCVAMSHVHWADGYLFDLFAIRQRCDEVGAFLIIDGTQSIGALPFSVEEIRPDALICGSYKWLMGPYSMGLAYYSEKFNDGTPIEQNWITRKDSDNFKDLVTYQDDYRPGAYRYSVGEMSNIIMIPMLQKAIEQLAKWQPQNIQIYVDSITKSFIKEATNKGYKITPKRAHHLFGLEIPPHVSLDIIKEKLTQQKVYVSFRGNVMRIAPNVYNAKEDLDNLLLCL